MRKLVFAVFMISGCVNPDGDLDAFRNRLRATSVADSGADAVDGGACSIRPGDIRGEFLLAISVSVAPTKPIVALLEVTSPAVDGGAGLAFTAQPLAASDRTTPVGPAVSLGPFPVDGAGVLHASIANLTVVGDANPITPGAPITADLVLTGNLCAKSRAYCGTVTGQATKPLTLSLDGSTFTLTPIEPGGSIPVRPEIDCQGTLADPL